MSPWVPQSVWIERGEETTPLAQRVLARLPHATIRLVDDPWRAEPSAFAAGKERLVLKRHHGSFVQHCPAGTPGMVCCNYLVMSVISNCPFDCSYCFLQDYLANNPAVKAYTNVGDGLAELLAILRAHPQRTFRVGTGELSDSLALDHLTDLSCELVPFFAERGNAVLELKTKSDRIDNLLRLDPKERVVVSWSVNADAIMATEEPGTTSLHGRVAAAVRTQGAGYKIGLHFDPLVAYDGWEEGYRRTVATLFGPIDPGRVAWVSLGSLRLTPRLKAAIRGRPQHARILDAELVPNPDGKERVWRGLRVKMYRRMLQWLGQVDARMPVYMCMEPPSVWERTFGVAPSDRVLAQRLLAAGC